MEMGAGKSRNPKTEHYDVIYKRIPITVISSV